MCENERKITKKWAKTGTFRVKSCEKFGKIWKKCDGFRRSRRRTEVGGLKTEIRGRRTEVRSQKSEDGGQRTEVRSLRTEDSELVD